MIHLLWCTIRPQVFLNSYNQWIKKASNKNNINAKVCVNLESHKTIINSELPDIEVLVTDKPDRLGVAYPSYYLSSRVIAEQNDIVVFASDDFLPPQNWDTYLESKMKGKTGSLMVRDGYQKPDSSNMLYPSITIPIMTYSCLEKMNKVIYHPSYYHMFSDSELYFNLKDMGLLIDDRMTDETMFEHHHYAAGKRNADQADQAYNDKWKEDEINWNKRRNLPVDERIKV